MKGRRANGEGTISLGAGMRKTYYRHSKAEALLALQQAQLAKMQGMLTSTRDETVESFLLNWLHYQIQPIVRERTYQSYQQVMTQYVLPALGRIKLQKFTHLHLQHLYQQKRRQHMAPSSIHKIHMDVYSHIMPALQGEAMHHLNEALASSESE